jgi:hypothetical protein
MRLSTSSRSLTTAGGPRGSRKMISDRPATAASYSELPNLPGIKRDFSATNPKLYRQFMASKSQTSLNDTVEGQSLMSYTFADAQETASMIEALSPFPQQGNAYNDLNGRYSLCSQRGDRLSKSRSLPYCSLDNVPSFVKDKNEKCRFLAYFTDKKLPDEYDRPDTKRSRKVEIVFNVDDNGIEITEPKVNNSGLLQGKILKSMPVQKPAGKARGDSNLVYTLGDFYAGAKLEIFNRIYTLVDCDNYTRRKMLSEGMPFGERLPLPADTYVPGSLRGPSRTEGSLHKSQMNLGFYSYGKKVLRFYGVWDDTGSLYGDLIHVRMHYFLADDTIEVLPIHERNTGRDKLPKFLKKTRIPLGTERDAISQANNTILQDGEPVPMYHWRDIFIGIKIQVATFCVHVLDADEFTRAFYDMMNMPLAKKIVLPQKKFELKERPPMSEAGLIGEEKTKDGAKLALFLGIQLRFMAKIANPKPEDVQRRFVIQVYMEDDTIQITEPPIRNSGIKGGLFLARTKVGSVRGGPPVQPTDIYLGCNLTVLSHEFEVYDADIATLKFMENHDFMWHFCDVSKILAKLKEKATVMRRVLLTTRGLADKPCTCAEFEEILNNANSGLVKQEAVTLFRSIDFATGKTGKIQLNTLLRQVL